MTTDETQPTDQPEYPLLAAPADGVPPVIDTERALTDAARALADGHGPVALDAERTFAEAEASLALADARIADAQVDLFRALGGRWNRS